MAKDKLNPAADMIKALGLGTPAEAVKAEPAVVKDKRITNEALLPWPQDKYNMCQGLRREGARSIGRMAGSVERLELFMKTLAVLAEYAEAKLEWQIKSKEDLKTVKDKRAKAAAALIFNSKRAAAAKLRKEAKEAEAAAKVIEAELEG